MSKPIIQLNEESVTSELKDLVRNNVEETPNEPLNKDSDGKPRGGGKIKYFHS